MSISCPKCSATGSGNFCAQCGSSFSEEINCRKCGNTIPSGGRFCNLCGTAVAPAREASATVKTGGTSNVPWMIAGAAVLVLAGVILAPRFNRAEPAPFAAATSAPSAAAAAPISGPAAIDLSSMTPREAADRLFNRVMQSVSAGDSVQARTFAPMAISAYDLVPELDLDGRYHIAVLHLVNNDAASARAVADDILEQVPTHLFGLFTAAQAETLAGRPAEAATLYKQFLDEYGDEMVSGRPEYEEHAPVLPAMRQEAEQRAAD